MSEASQRDTLMDAMRESVAAFLTGRVIDRSLKTIDGYKAEDLRRGVLAIVAAGGGNFANWQGREGELGTIRFKVVGFVMVAEQANGVPTEPVEVERAEHALLEDWLRWVGEFKAPPLDALYPGNYQQSTQLEHPYGWFVLDMEARFV